MPFTDWSTGDVITATKLDNDNTVSVGTDTARTISVTHTWTASQTFTGGFTAAAAISVGSAASTTPQFRVTDGTATFPTATIPDSSVNIGAVADTAAVRFVGVNAGTSIKYIGYRCNTSVSSPTAVASGDAIVALDARGYRNSAWNTTNQGEVAIYATETWSATAAGTEIRFSVTPNTTTSTRHAVTIENDGDLLAKYRLLCDDATDASNGVDGSIQTDGGLSVVKKAWIGTGLIVNTGIAYIGDSANAKMTTGLTINQGASDDEILCFKSSDVAHGMTDQAETDTYGVFRKNAGADGGLEAVGYGDGTIGISMRGRATTGDTTKTTAAVAPLYFQAAKANGTTVQAMGADENLMVIDNGGGSARFIFDQEGTFHADVGSTTF